ncbi:hypothetical protein TNCV_3956401 [Trichonephila clavipes]|nr:hypothetical protein TNCV_3956401 [Trichonephila clavipes]
MFSISPILFVHLFQERVRFILLKVSKITFNPPYQLRQRLQIGAHHGLIDLEEKRMRRDSFKSGSDQFVKGLLFITDLHSKAGVKSPYVRIEHPFSFFKISLAPLPTMGQLVV